MLKFDSVAIDEVKHRDGVWVDSVAIPGVRFHVRPMNNVDYQKAAAFEGQKLRRKYGANPPEDAFVKVIGKLIVEHILLDWDGFDIPYSKEKAESSLCDPKYLPLREAIEAAAEIAREPSFEYCDDKDDVKNS